MIAGDDHALIRRAVGGRDEAAAAILVRRLMPVIRARVRRLLARDHGRLAAEDGRDLVQEIWLRLIDGGGRQLLAFDPSRGATLEGFVGILAEREAHDLIRRASTKKRGGRVVSIGGEATEELASPAASPEETAGANELAARLGAHLERELPPKGRLVFRYAFTDELAPTEVARILGVTVQVVYNWQHKIRSAAKSFLEPAQ